MWEVKQEECWTKATCLNMGVYSMVLAFILTFIHSFIHSSSGFVLEQVESHLIKKYHVEKNGWLPLSFSNCC